MFQPQFLPNVRTLCRNNRPLGAEIENISALVLRFWVQKGLSKSEKRSEYPLPYRRKKPYFSKKADKKGCFLTPSALSPEQPDNEGVSEACQNE